MATMTSVPGTRAINAMCRLLADYRSQSDTRASLTDIRRELGDAEYAAFERELKREMFRVPAWKAVSNIIGAALRRKKALMDDGRSRRINGQ